MFDFHTHDIKPDSVYNLIVGRDAVPASGFFTAGIHPWFIQNGADQYAELELIARLPKCIAIGECGLDRLKGSDLSSQFGLFQRQIQLATILSKPLIIHCVKAHNELLAIKKKSGSEQPWIIHGFNQNTITGLRLMNEGFYFSLGKPLLHPDSNSSKLIASIPTSRLFLETDSADITIEEVYKSASERLKLPMQDLVNNLQTNFKTVFKING